MERTLFNDSDRYPDLSIPQPMTVSDLNAFLKGVIEPAAKSCCVTGEISSAQKANSGHIYFTLKDRFSQIRCVIWRSLASRLQFDIENGTTVICRGRIEIYIPNGSYQLIVSEIEPKGVGKLELAFRQLGEKLKREGLFASDRKKPIPHHLNRIAVVTSPSGAAVRDFFNIMRRRSHRVDLYICPVLVQGEGASLEIARAIADLNSLSPESGLLPDAIALIRGGGSMEDLWAFNEERTVRAVAASRIPIVTGIGHEIDVTLSDLAADIRALTPSDAALRLIPDDSEIPQTLNNFENRLTMGIERKLAELSTRVLRIADSALFTSPADRILAVKRMITDQFEARLNRTADTILTRGKNQVSELSAKLNALSPLGVLSRGYSITFNNQNQSIRCADDAAVGDTIRTRFNRGELLSTVIEITPSAAEEV